MSEQRHRSSASLGFNKPGMHTCTHVWQEGHHASKFSLVGEIRRLGEDRPRSDIQEFSVSKGDRVVTITAVLMHVQVYVESVDEVLEAV